MTETLTPKELELLRAMWDEYSGLINETGISIVYATIEEERNSLTEIQRKLGL